MHGAGSLSAGGNATELTADIVDLPRALPQSSMARKRTEKQPGVGMMKYLGVVHFLFLVNNDIPQAALWRTFFADAPAGSYRALVHCRDPEGCKKSGLLKKLPNLQQVS